MMRVKMLVVTHKEYPMPGSDCYFPIHAGAEGKEKLDCTELVDSTGDNISTKNRNYCELTAIYWAWKNLNADYYGICHYRRYFKGKNGIADCSEIQEWLKKSKMILPRRRNYFIETNYSQYIHAHHKQDLDICRTVVSELYPEDAPSWETVMNRTWGHRFNMFIMSRELFFEYCEWLFSILFELEKRLDISGYSEYDSRVFGFVSERLLDIFVETRAIQFREVSVYETEKTRWIPKIASFLSRKFRKSE